MEDLNERELETVGRFLAQHDYSHEFAGDCWLVVIPWYNSGTDERGALVREVSTMAECREELGY